MVQLISNFMFVCTKLRVNAFFLVHSIKTGVFNHSTWVFKFVFDSLGFAGMRLSSTCEYVMSSDSSLCVHKNSLYALISSSNSRVPVRIGNHNSKGRALILLVMTTFYYQFNLLTTADSAIPLYTRVPELTN